MAFENSPSLKDYTKGLPSQPPERPAGHRRVWIGIGSLVFLIMVLALVDLQSSEQTTLLSGSDTVVGAVVDEAGNPLQAEIFVLKTDLQTQTDANGRFELASVPAGAQVVVVAYLGAGREYPVVVHQGAITDIGKIQFVSTKVPEQ